jgi:hypothetical protein
MSPDDASTLAFKIFYALEKHYLIGYVLFVLSLVFFILFIKYMRKSFSKEIERVVEQRNELQKKITGIEFKSSKNK